MTPVAIPVPGTRESATVEFKSAAILGDLDRVARAVVAFLNDPGSDGGELWIGVPENDGAAAAPEHVPDAESQRGRVFDHLVDSIRPSIASHVHVSVVTEGATSVLRVEVRKVGRAPPFAIVRRDGLVFVRRADARTLRMDYSEVREAFHRADSVDATRDSEEVASRERLARLREETRTRIGGAGLFVAVVPQPRTNELVHRHAAELDELLNSPGRSGSRSAGWSAASSHAVPRAARILDRLARVLDRGGRRITAIHDDGAVVFGCDGGSLSWGRHATDLFPFALCEFTASTLRLAAAALRLVNPAPVGVRLELAVFDAAKRTLRPHSPTSFEHDFAEAHAWTGDGPDFTLPEPKEVAWREFADHPDRQAFRLIKEVYAAWGLGESAIPREFDRRSLRLLLPEA